MRKITKNVKCVEMGKPRVFANNVILIFVIHALNVFMIKKKNTNHKKEKIDYFVPIDTRCPEHEGNRINLFCIDEKGKNIYIFLIFINYRIMLCLLSLFKSS